MLPQRPLLALIGASGAGKSSYLRAGLVAHAPPRWRCAGGHSGPGAVRRAGAGPGAVLRRRRRGHPAADRLPPARGGAGAGRTLGRGMRRRRWWWSTRPRSCSPSTAREVQARFAELLGRLAEAARGARPPLAARRLPAPVQRLPVAQGGFRGPHPARPARRLRPAPGPGGAGRTARLRPFEDEALVEEMLAAGGGGAGRAAPARLRGRAAVGGAGSAAEAAHAGGLRPHRWGGRGRSPGTPRRPWSGWGRRAAPGGAELFRNLDHRRRRTRCTAPTPTTCCRCSPGAAGKAERGARSRGRRAAADLLRGRRPRTGAGAAGSEVVHESLLRTWPRLVRWQAQGRGGRRPARPAAPGGRGCGRGRAAVTTCCGPEPPTASSRCGGSTTPAACPKVEEGLWPAPWSPWPGRRRRRRRALVGAALALSVAVAATVGVLWRRSVQETRRAEASRLLALAQVRLADGPHRGAGPDHREPGARRHRTRRASCVVRALQTAPPALELDMGGERAPPGPSFSPDGRHVAVAGLRARGPGVVRGRSGPDRARRHTTTPRRTRRPGPRTTLSSPARDRIFRRAVRERVQMWSIPKGSSLRAVDFGRPRTGRSGPVACSP